MKDIRIAEKNLLRINQISSNDESISLLYSIYTTVLLSREIFILNTDIEDFLTPILDKLQSQPEFSRLKKPIQFKEYVYKSRSLIVARFIRIIQKSEGESINILKKEIQLLINSKQDTDIEKKKNKNKTQGLRKNKKNTVDELFKNLGRY